MKAALFGKTSESFFTLLREEGVELVPCKEASIIITYGGDGSLLEAERLYPGIPKFPVRDGETAPLCSCHGHRSQIRDLVAGKPVRTELPKLVCRKGGNTILKGINDIFLHNIHRESGIRCRISVDGKVFVRELIGDGAGVSTVHGSTAYYRNITKSIFRTGVGLAFVNCSDPLTGAVLPENSRITLRLLRGEAEISSDNNPVMPVLSAGEECEISLSEERAVVFGLEVFMCEECRFLRHRERYEFLKEDPS